MSTTSPDGSDGVKGRVLILVENLSVPFDRRVWKEARALVHAGYRVTVICPRGKESDTAPFEEIEGVRIHRFVPYEATGGAASYILEYGVAMLKMAWGAARARMREGFDVIHLCNPPDTLILIALPFRLFGARVLFDQHDLAPDLFLEQRGQDAKGLLYRALLFFERLTYRWAHRVITVNESCRRIVMERGGVPPERVGVVRNGLERSAVAPLRFTPLACAGPPFDLVYVGMMGPQDGVDVLLRVARHLREIRGESDFHVRIIGTGTALPSLQEYARELEVDSLVTFMGRLPHAEVLRAIDTASVCVCPDPKTPMNDKASMIKVVEYMAKAKPVVAFELDEVRLMAGDAAVFAPPGDEKAFAECIHRLLDDARLREDIGKRARDRVLDGLTWEHAEGVLLNVYAELMRG